MVLGIFFVRLRKSFSIENKFFFQDYFYVAEKATIVDRKLSGGRSNKILK